MTTETMYRVTASYERDGQVVDCSQAEVLGDAYGILYPTREAAEAAAEIEQAMIDDTDLDPSTTYSVEVAPLGWGRASDDHIRDMVATVTAIPGVIHDGSDSIGVCVREALRLDPRATAAEIAEEIIEAQEDARVERERA